MSYVSTSPPVTPEVGKSTSNHSVHSHLGWHAVVPCPPVMWAVAVGISALGVLVLVCMVDSAGGPGVPASVPSAECAVEVLVVTDHEVGCCKVPPEVPHRVE